MAGYSNKPLVDKLGIRPGLCAVDETRSGLKLVRPVRDR